MPTKDASYEVALAEAQRWWQRLREPGRPAETEQAFFAWIQASSLHADAYLRVASAASAPAEATIDDSAASLPTTRRWPLAVAAVLLAVSACLIGVWLHSTRVQEVHWLAPHGERSAHVLEDGSSVLLASEAEVTVRYSKTERLVRLDHGQAYFQVAKGDGRRFRVVAGDSSVVATGTQFDVRLEDHREVVSLLEGRVEVYADSLALEEEGATEGPAVRALRAGEQVTVRDGRISMPVRVNEQAIRAWQRGQLVAKGMPLADVLQEYNRYRRSPLHTADPSLAEIRIGGVFNLDDSDTLLSFLRSSLSIDSRQTPEGVELYRAAPASRTETR